MRIKSIKYICFIIVGFVLMLSSCSSTQISTQIEGKVISKRYEQAETHYGILPLWVIPDEESNSMQYVGEIPILASIPMAIEDDEDYLITLETPDLAYSKLTINVSREVYEATIVGETRKFTNYESVLETDSVMRPPTSKECVEHVFIGAFPYVRRQ